MSVGYSYLQQMQEFYQLNFLTRVYNHGVPQGSILGPLLFISLWDTLTFSRCRNFINWTSSLEYIIMAFLKGQYWTITVYKSVGYSYLRQLQEFYQLNFLTRVYNHGIPQGSILGPLLFISLWNTLTFSRCRNFINTTELPHWSMQSFKNTEVLEALIL